MKVHTYTVLHPGVQGIEQCHSSLKIKNLDENFSDDPKYVSFRINWEKSSDTNLISILYVNRVVASSSRTKRGKDMAGFAVGESVRAQTLTEWDLFVIGNFRV